MHGFGLGGCCGGFGLFGGMELAGGMLGLALTLALLAGVVVFVVWAARRFTHGGGAAGFSQQARAELSPREIVQQRYARGEITREQYRDILADLS